MHINTTITIAVRCKNCGKLSLEDLSVFDFSGTKKVTRECSCSNMVFTIKTSDYKKYIIDVACMACDKIHTYNLDNVYNSKLKMFNCDATQMEVCFVGKKEDILTAIDNRGDDHSNITNNGFDDGFSNFLVMYQVFNKVQDIAENNNLQCQCGSGAIKVEMLNDRILLTCKNCGSKGVVYGSTNEDLYIINKKECITIGQSKVRYST